MRFRQIGNSTELEIKKNELINKLKNKVHLLEENSEKAQKDLEQAKDNLEKIHNQILTSIKVQQSIMNSKGNKSPEYLKAE